jgi:streptogramin lyase
MQTIEIFDVCFLSTTFGLVKPCVYAATTAPYTQVAGTGITPSSVGVDGGIGVFARMSGPMHMIPDNSGNVLIADNSNARIRRFNPVTSTLSTFFFVTSAQVTSIVVDNAGGYLVSDVNQFTNQVRRYSSAGALLSVVSRTDNIVHEVPYPSPTVNFFVLILFSGSWKRYPRF